ncbi:MFS transporter [Dysgonomonas sp. 511]|uniref:MFS transporter n=1 Tax=Dysgonomonas sp. 511 TaxID=2302930 RepID=UPI0013D60707|nr:MFS transporter [Dysgonomonas sp. 511]NDV78729.1 MFS transporter [Dysgonomonas sp. 511]
MNNWKRTFTIIWSGQFFSMLSSAIVGFAVVFWLSMETGSPKVLAYSMLAVLMPFIVLGLFTGVFVDRWDRRRTMIIADSFVALCSAVLAILFFMGRIEMWEIYLLLALRSAGSAFHTPAMQASVPLLAPESELMRVAGINQMIQSVSNIAGPALGAVFVAFFDMGYIMLFDVVGAAIACTSLMFVTIPNPEKKENVAPHIWREIKEGIGHMFGEKGLSYLLACVIIVTFFMVPIGALFPLMTINYFGGSEFQMGLVEVCWGSGMLIGGAIVSLRFMKTVNKIYIINITTILMGLAFWACGLLPASAFIVFVVITTIGGVVSSIYWGTFVVILQTRIDPAALGRVFSIYDSISLLPTIPGLLATGFIAEKIGLLNAFIVAGIATLIVGILAFFAKPIMQLGKVMKKKGEPDTEE